jgi:hypothetical protein
MTLKIIDEIFVYTSSTENAVEGFELNAWFDHSDIPHVKLNYVEGDKVLEAVNTWWQSDDKGIKQEPLTTFPFIIYTEAHSDKPISYLPRKYIQGKDNIISQLPELYSLGR